jgi:hypothetical protein
MYDTTEEQMRLYKQGVLKFRFDDTAQRFKLWNPNNGTWVYPTDGFLSVLIEQFDDKAQRFKLYKLYTDTLVNTPDEYKQLLINQMSRSRYDR